MSGRRTILLVEDDENDVILLERAFAQAGVLERLCVARNGAQAIAYLSGEGEFADRQAHPFPSLVLLDLNLGMLSGFEVLRWIRSRPELRHRMVVVVLSVNETPESIRMAYELGANSYLAKPFGFGKLVALAKDVKAYWLEHNQLAGEERAGE